MRAKPRRSCCSSGRWSCSPWPGSCSLGRGRVVSDLAVFTGGALVLLLVIRTVRAWVVGVSYA